MPLATALVSEVSLVGDKKWTGSSSGRLVVVGSLVLVVLVSSTLNSYLASAQWYSTPESKYESII